MIPLILPRTGDILMGYWLLRPWRHAYDFRGRSPRREYWLFVLQFYLLLLVTAMMVAFTGAGLERTGSQAASLIFAIMLGMFFLLCLVPWFAVTVRRLHDHDKPGILLLLAFVPAIGWLFMLFYTVMPGSDGENNYGPDPRDRALERVAEIFE